MINRIRQLLWRYHPQFLYLEKRFVQDLGARALATRTHRLRKTNVAKLLKQHRVRRIGTDEVLNVLRTPPMTLAPGTENAVCTSLRLAFDQLELNQRQIHQANVGID